MKFLKLLGVLLVVIGIIVGIMFLGKGGGAKTGHASKDGAYKTLADEITTEWSQAKGWNSPLFTKHLNKITQSYKAGLLKNPTDTSQLRDLLCNEACEVTVKALEKSFSTSGCKKKSVDADYAGIVTLTKYMGKDPRLSQAKSTYDTYVEILNFCLSSHTFKTRFDGNETKQYTTKGGVYPSGTAVYWTPYKDFESNEIYRRNSYQGNAVYKSKLSKISELKDGLARVENTMKNNRWDYYNRLEREIHEFFQGMDTEQLTKENKDKYATMYQNFYVEVSPYEAADANLSGVRGRLLTSKNAFAKLVDDEMAKREEERKASRN